MSAQKLEMLGDHPEILTIPDNWNVMHNKQSEKSLTCVRLKISFFPICFASSWKGHLVHLDYCYHYSFIIEYCWISFLSHGACQCFQSNFRNFCACKNLAFFKYLLKYWNIEIFINYNIYYSQIASELKNIFIKIILNIYLIRFYKLYI